MSLIQQISRFTAKNSPIILTVIGVTGVLSTAIFTGRATLEASTRVAKREVREGHALTKKEIFKLCWRDYVPATIMGVVTCASIIGAHNIHTRRSAAIMGLYTLTETTLSNYKDKVVDMLGANEERKIRESIDKDRLDADPVSKKEVYITGKGEVLCYDCITGRYFRSEMETIRRAVNDVNATAINQSYVSLNEFYSMIGLMQTVIGDTIGWNSDRLLEISYDTMLSEKSEPCIVMNYKAYSDYGNLH